MKRFLPIFLFLALFCSSAHAGVGRVDQLWSGQVVNGTGNTVVSKTIPIGSANKVGIWFKAANGASVGSTIKLSMVMQGSYDDTSANYATLNTVVTAYSFATPTVVSLNNISMKYARFVAQGATGNATDTTVTAYVFTQDL